MGIGTSPQHRPLKRKLLAAAICALAISGACGSTQSGAQKNAAAQTDAGNKTPAAASPDVGSQAAAAPAPSPAGDTATPAPAPAAGTSAAPAPAAAAATGGATASPAVGAQPSRAADRSAPASAASPAPASKGGAAGGATSAPVAPTPGTPGKAPAAPAPASGGPKNEIVLGAIGVHSGVIGDILKPVELGARAWAGDINARGGLNGHPVKLIVADDGGDPAKAVSLARKLIDENHVTAFYALQAPATLEAIASVAEQYKIPIVGDGCSCASQRGGDSPMLFGVGFTANRGMAWSHAMFLRSGKKKVSLLACREAPICQSVKQHLKEWAPELGYQVVHEADVSMAAPDYTAEVLAAKAAGADVVAAIVENAATVRIIQAAHRQDYNPIFTTQASAHDERFPQRGKQEAEGTWIGAAMLNWDNPKMADYKAAMARYVPGGILASFGETAYMDGKLLEVMAPGFPDQAGPADILKGLYSVKNETLGDRVAPLNFKEGVSHDEVNLCVWPTTVKDGKFVQEDKLFCKPGWTQK